MLITLLVLGTAGALTVAIVVRGAFKRAHRATPEPPRS
jgi:hypothetical protein